MHFLVVFLGLAEPGAVAPDPSVDPTASRPAPPPAQPATPAADPSDRPPPRHPPPPPAEPDLQRPSNYLHLSPGLLGLAPIADAGIIAYVWGLAGGRYLTAGKRFAAAVGGFGEHAVIWYFPGGDVEPDAPIDHSHEMRLGAEVRIGGRPRQRLFAYGLGRLGAALTFDYDYTIDHYDGTPPIRVHRAVYPSIMGSLGGGVQGLLGRRFLLGGEGFFDLGGDAFIMFRARLLVGIRF